MRLGDFLMFVIARWETIFAWATDWILAFWCTFRHIVSFLSWIIDAMRYLAALFAGEV